MKKLILLLLFFMCSRIQSEEKFVIGCLHGGGFFAHFFAVLNQLGWCEKNGKTPVVYWDKDSYYYQIGGYNNSNNVWEYYFEPVSDLHYNARDPIYKNYFAPDNSGIQYQLFNGLDILSYKFWGNVLIKRYIKIKDTIMKKIDDFEEKYMKGHEMIGIHVRGTDKYNEVAPVPLETIIQEAQKHPNALFFVATDEAALLEKLKTALPNRVIYYNSFRSKNHLPLHYNNPKISKAHLGEEVLIEVQLLSRCKKLIHTCSNVSCAVLFFNPYMENILFNR